MQEVVELYSELQSAAKANGDVIAQEFSVNHQEPAAFFGMAFNSITLTLELLFFYNQIWGSSTSTTCSSIDEAVAQNGERVMLIQKMSFISLMSNFEYSAKKIVLSKPVKFGSFDGRVYLRRIMKRSFEKGIINQESRDLWYAAINLRNSLVHNNGISEETASYTYPEVDIHVCENKMTQGNLKSFGLLSKWLLSEAQSWLLVAHQ